MNGHYLVENGKLKAGDKLVKIVRKELTVSKDSVFVGYDIKYRKIIDFECGYKVYRPVAKKAPSMAQQ